MKLTGRACRERLDRLITKYAEDDKKALKKFHKHVERFAKIRNPGNLRLQTPNGKTAVCSLRSPIKNLMLKVSNNPLTHSLDPLLGCNLYSHIYVDITKFDPIIYANLRW